METTLASKLPIVESFSAEYLEQWGILPLEIAGERLRVAVAGDAPDPEVLADLERTFGVPLDIVPVPEPELRDAIRRTYANSQSVVELVKVLGAELTEGSADPDGDGITDTRDVANQPNVVKYVNLLIRDAHTARASDIHLESTRDGLRTRFRVDGVLVDAPSPPREMQAAVVSLVKLTAQLDIAERRVPQDGRIRIRLEQRELDLRVSAVPTLQGESLVLRLLDRGGRPVGLEELGMSPPTFETFRRLMERPHGIILATGPTGSGKTTTLYAALGLRRHNAEKIITIEDPVEYHLAGITQVPINTKAGMTFAGALRSLLRQDPNVLMVGEIRDAETADVAAHASLTGHLVLSTLHTNDAISAVPRLLDLQVERYMISATVEAVLAQRLVRRICPDCRERYRPEPRTVALLAQRPVGDVRLVRGRGCESCRNTGYRGRTGIFELFVVSDAIQESLKHKVDVRELREIASAEGMVPLIQDGWSKVEAGITTIEEVLRVADR